jgi:predicted RNase H-like HicB family nuclease
MNDADVRGYRLEVYRDPEDGSWVAEVPDLPGCIAGGQTADEAVEMAADAIEAWVEAAAATGRAVPSPRAVDEELSGRFVLRISRRLHAQLARLARSEGVSLNAYCSIALAEAVGASQAQTDFVIPRFFVPDRPAMRPSSVPDTMAIYQVGDAMVMAGKPVTRTIGTAKAVTQ